MTDLPRIYATDSEIAAMLGRSVSWLRDNAAALERQSGEYRYKSEAVVLVGMRGGAMDAPLHRGFG